MRPSAGAKRTSTPDLARFRRAVEEGRPGPHDYALLVGLKAREPDQLLAAVERGLPYGAFEHLRKNIDLSTEELTRIVRIPLRTLSRRKEKGRLEPDESDRLLRLSRVFAGALELFEGDAQGARAWLAQPQPALGGESPLRASRTEVGAREVETLLGRLEHGVFS